MRTGKFIRRGNWPVNKEFPPASPNSGLAALILGESAGYRVYYHDKDMRVNEIGFTNDQKWIYRGIISEFPQTSSAIHAAFGDKGSNANISVAMTHGSDNIGISRLFKDGYWHLCTQRGTSILLGRLQNPLVVLLLTFPHSVLPEAPGGLEHQQHRVR